ncbi:MAG TPA: BlaI/MecI/CopY family transcriptional regulator [Pirellulales bacterium]
MGETAPSTREMDVLKVLWRLGEVPVRDVHQALSADGPCAFTTVQTLLRIMAGKGLVAQRARGRTLYYKAKYTAQQAATRFLHKVFDGSLDQFVLSMLESEKHTPEELRQLEKMISRARRQRSNP